MMYLVDFIRFIFEQFSFIFDFIRDFLYLIDLFDIFNLNTWGLPSWLFGGFWILFFIPVIFRITQIVPVIGGFDS